MTWLTILSALKRVPRAAWGLLLGVLLLVAVYAFHLNRVNSAYAEGKRAAAAGVSFDSALVARVAEVVALRTAHTDTVWLRAKESANKATAAVASLPPEVRDVPQVDTLVQTVGVLLTAVDSLGTAITAERAAWTERAKVDSANVYALRVLATAQRDTITTLAKRPTRKKAALVALGAAAAGFLGGMAR